MKQHTKMYCTNCGMVVEFVTFLYNRWRREQTNRRIDVSDCPHCHKQRSLTYYGHEEIQKANQNPLDVETQHETI